jgi:1-acyl-sn-glycerol-3-phosphate acyltransferase
VDVKRFFRIIIYTFSIYVVTHAVVFTMLPAGIILVARDREKTVRIIKRFTDILFRIVGKEITISGMENFEQGKRYIIVANYPSFYAGFALIRLFPNASVVAHGFVSKVPLFGKFLERIGTIFVNPKRMKSTVRAIGTGIGETHESGSIIIFPEGHRTPDGVIQRFRRGFIYMLRQGSFELLPVTLNGFYRLKPVNRLYIDPDAEPEVVIHRPISSSETCKMNDRELLEKTVAVIKSVYTP